MINLISIRIVLSIVLGFALGLEREITSKYAGLRTHILVCMGACVFTILSIYSFPTYAAGDNIMLNNATGVRDTARVAAQIVTGIGFIGAGTVLRHGSSIFGLTTAATLWMAASIGMACGAGAYDVAIIATLGGVFVLIMIKFFEKRVLADKKVFNKRLKVHLECEASLTDKIFEVMSSSSFHLHNIERYRKDCDNYDEIKFELNLKAGNPINYLHKKFEKLEGIKSITIQESDG